MSGWTPGDVEDRLADAAAVLQHLPEDRYQGYASTWPVIRGRMADAVPGRMRVLPSPAAISRMEEAITWTLGLDPIDGKIAWRRAFGRRWKKICWEVGLQRSAAQEHWLYALCWIALRLNRRRFGAQLSRRRVIELARPSGTE